MSGAAVGNDVVDLGDPAALRSYGNKRFVTRVCDPAESAHATSLHVFWALFAAKEATYKALVKLGAAPGFAHRAIRVAPDFSSVAWADRRFALSVTGDADHLHALAWTGGAPPRAVVAPNVGVARDEGERARAALRETVALALGCEARELTVVRDPAPGGWDGYGPPRVERNGERVDADVSLSHDGRFVAAAVLVTNAARRL